MGSRILIVDDDALVAAFMTDTLTRLGHTTLEVTSGLEAVEKLSTDSAFDLVLTDLHMGKMDGYDLTERLRLTHPDLPVVLVTADGHAGEDRRCRTPVLLKPYTRDELKQVVTDASCVAVH